MPGCRGTQASWWPGLGLGSLPHLCWGRKPRRVCNLNGVTFFIKVIHSLNDSTVITLTGQAMCL